MPRRLLPRRTPCTLIRVPSMRARAARRLPGSLAPSTIEPYRGDAVPTSCHLRASRQPSSTSSSPHHASLELASCHITQSLESHRGHWSYHCHGPGLPCISSRITELFPAPPGLVIHEPPLTPTSPEACMFKFPGLATGPSTKLSHRNAGATTSSSSIVLPMCGLSPSLPNAAVTSLRQ
jgi:hypothetical protein